MRTLRLPGFKGVAIFCLMTSIRCCSFASSSTPTFSISVNRPWMISRSPPKSAFQVGISMSARSIWIFLPMVNSPSPEKSSSSVSKLSTSLKTSSILPLPPLVSKRSMASCIAPMFRSSAPSVRRKASTELSRRFRRFVVISACRLRSRSAWRNVPLEPSVLVS